MRHTPPLREKLTQRQTIQHAVYLMSTLRLGIKTIKQALVPGLLFVSRVVNFRIHKLTNLNK